MSFINVVVLASMGECLDGNNTYSPTVGDICYCPAQNQLYVVKVIVPSQPPQMAIGLLDLDSSAFYYNILSGNLYQWNGVSMQELTTKQSHIICAC